MRSKLLVVMLLAVMPGFALGAKIPDGAWQTGTLRSISTDSGSRTVGILNDGHGVLTQREYVITHYIIEGPQYTYEANLLLKGRHAKQLLVTVHGPIRFALVGHDFYIVDDEGKIRKLVFVERALR